MQHYRILTALALTGALAGCSGGTGTLGPGTTFAQLAARHSALETSVDNLEATEGATLLTELPDTPGSDTASYSGTIHGTPNGGSGGHPDVEFYADLTMQADFDATTISGELSNVKTTVSGFTSPTGTATLTGSIVDSGGDAGISSRYSGDFTQGTTSATIQSFNYPANTMSGTFVGDSAQAASGTHASDFIWLTGPDSGTTSYSDGDWFLEQD